MYSDPIQNEETFHQNIFMPVEPFATTPGPLKECNSPWSDISMRVLIQVEDILSICCELWSDKQ
jgi:hypothetical protein